MKMFIIFFLFRTLQPVNIPVRTFSRQSQLLNNNLPNQQDKASNSDVSSSSKDVEITLKMWNDATKKIL